MYILLVLNILVLGIIYLSPTIAFYATKNPINKI